MPYEDETYEDEQPEPGHLDEEEELGAGPRRPVGEEEPEEELEIDRPTYAPPPPALPKAAAPKKKAKPKRKKKTAPKKSRGKARKSKKRSAKKSNKSKGRKKGRR